MSIESFCGVYTPVCDVCGDELPDEFSFYEAVDAKKLAGWRSRKVDDGWEDVCCECQEQEDEDEEEP